MTFQYQSDKSLVASSFSWSRHDFRLEEQQQVFCMMWLKHSILSFHILSGLQQWKTKKTKRGSCFILALVYLFVICVTAKTFPVSMNSKVLAVLAQAASCNFKHFTWHINLLVSSFILGSLWTSLGTEWSLDHFWSWNLYLTNPRQSSSLRWDVLEEYSTGEWSWTLCSPWNHVDNFINLLLCHFWNVFIKLNNVC